MDEDDARSQQQLEKESETKERQRQPQRVLSRVALRESLCMALVQHQSPQRQGDEMVSGLLMCS